MHCPRCQHENRSQAKFCEECGSSLAQACGHCGAALSTSAQRELLARLKELSFHGVPALPGDKKVRAAVERAWFEQQPLRITYVDSNNLESERTIRITSVHMERHQTHIDALDLERDERRPFRLDRIARASVIESVS